jgi:hypothetical protein
VGGSPVPRSSGPPFAGSERLGGNGVDIVVGGIGQEARFRQHCGGDGSRVVVCWHPGSRHLCLSLGEQLIPTGPTFRWPGRPCGDALGPVALVAALGHVPGDLVAVLGERLTNTSATPTTAHYRPRPRARRAGCRSPTTGPSPERAGGRPSWPPPNNSRSAAESRPPLNHPWRRASHSSSSPGCDRAGPDHPPERWRDGYGRRQRPGRGPAPGSAPLAATDLELAVEPLHRGVGVGVITAVVMTTRGPRGSPT